MPVTARSQLFDEHHPPRWQGILSQTQLRHSFTTVYDRSAVYPQSVLAPKRLDASCATNSPASCSQRHPSADGYHSAPSFTHHLLTDTEYDEELANQDLRCGVHGERRDAAAFCVDKLVGRLGFMRDGEVTVEDLLDPPPRRRKVRWYL